MADYADLIARLDRATESSTRLDEVITDRLFPDTVDHCLAYGTPAYTASLDAAVSLVEKMLPGWWWKVGTCCVSDDACMAPDFNSPVHGERLKAQFFPLKQGSEFDCGFDVDRRPPGNLPIALLTSLFLALQSIEQKDAG